MPTPSAGIEKRLQQAIKAVRTGQINTFPQAAKHYYVDYDLLIARSHGRPTNHIKGGQNKKLTEEEDQSLRRYCERCIIAGDPPERYHIKAAANSICCATGKKPVSKPWLTRWIKRNPDLLKKKKSKSLATERKATHEIEEIREYFRRFERARDKYEIKPENYWNFDETG